MIRRYLWPLIGGLITILSIVYATIAYEQAQRQTIEYEVARTLKQYRGEQKSAALMERLIQAEERAKMWRSILSQHPQDMTARKSLEYWEGEVEAIRQKMRGD